MTFPKKQGIVEFWGLALSLKIITIRFLAKILGKLSSSFIAVPLGKLFYRDLEQAKTTALKFHKQNFDKVITLTEDCRLEE